MQHKTLYVLGIAAVVLASCKEDADGPHFLNGMEKTPLSVSALMGANNTTQTRAVDMAFDENDKLIAYLRHVTWDGNTEHARTLVTVDQSPKLVTFTKGDDDMTAYPDDKDITPIGTGVALGLTSTNTKQAEDLTPDTPLYWDDFSKSTSTGTEDLRTENHYLESYYGYCYNGGTPSTALAPTTGILGWTVATDQSSGFKTSDLLWSAEQTPVRYSHETSRAGLVLPYTHAMSKVTVEVVCDEGFDDDAANFSDASVVLQQMNTVSTLHAPDATVTDPGTPADITMQKIASDDNKKKSFAALIAQTKFGNGLELAKINNIGGNDYVLSLTHEILDTDATNDWASRLTGYTSETKSGTTQPGVNYLITVTVKKQEITVTATIKDWDKVSAETTGIINFAKDVKDITLSETSGKSPFSGDFDIYRKTSVANDAYPELEEYGTKATTAHMKDNKWSYGYWDAVGTTWTEAPIYWPQDNLPLYFRALSGANADTPLKLETNRDLLWGTTDAHSGKYVDGTDYSYAVGAAIDPRTQDIPFIFYHTMSKVQFILQNDAAASDDEKVTLNGASVQLIKLYGSATLDLHTGSLSYDANSIVDNIFTSIVDDVVTPTPATTTYVSADDKAKTTDDGLFVVPQDIDDNARVQVILADGTKYSAQLNTCTCTSTSTTNHTENLPINAWYGNTSYVYTITLGKEGITFRGMVRDWVDVKGSGTAEMEW